jgi:hypothetical protein
LHFWVLTFVGSADACVPSDSQVRN